MAKFNLPWVKDLGLQRKVMDALPYAVVGGAWEGSFEAPMGNDDEFIALTHIVPAGQQLKILFLRVWTQEQGGARYSIVQTNPTALGQTGTTEAFPVVGSVGYDSDLPPGTGVRDYPMLEAPGAEVLRGSLRDPVHVLEGSIDFRILAMFPGAPAGAPNQLATGARYGIVWWGVEKVPE